jgi:hypothetical protein
MPFVEACRNFKKEPDNGLWFSWGSKYKITRRGSTCIEERMK